MYIWEIIKNQNENQIFRVYLIADMHAIWLSGKQNVVFFVCYTMYFNIDECNVDDTTKEKRWSNKPKT